MPVAAAHEAAEGDGGEGAERPRLGMVFAVVSIALLIYSIDTTVVATALHTLHRDLQASISLTGWTITVYAVAQILVLPLTGKLAIRHGRRRVFMVCVATFTLASLACGFANDIYVLVALRALQAIGGAGFTPSATGIVVDHFGPARDKVVGLFGSIFPIGAIIGPILGGLFVSYWSWRGIFFVNVPIGIAELILCARYVPRDRRHEVSEPLRVDLVGMAQLGLGVLAAMVGASYLGSAGAHPTAPAFVVPELVALFALAAFVHHTRTVREPFVAPRFLFGRGFGVMNVINFLWGGVSMGLGSLVPLYATQRYGIDALGSGTLLTTRGIVTIALSSLAALALRRTGYRGPMYVGFLLAAAGLIVLAVRPPGLGAYLWLSIGAGISGLGVGWSSPATRNAGLQLAPEHSATIAALRTMGMLAGSIIFISIDTAILAASAHPGQVQATIFGANAVLMIAAMPLISRVVEHRGSW